VGATNNTDARSSFSNFWGCVDLFAPGSGITSSWITSDTATLTISGTSMATPHVAGVAALYLERFPGSTPAAVSQAIVDSATAGVVGSPGSGSPNRLLFSPFDPSGLTTVFSDDFETDLGWLVNPDGTDTTSPRGWPSIDVSRFAGQTVHILIQAADGARGAVDDVTITQQR
jgi:subtilisin family serine protease